MNVSIVFVNYNTINLLTDAIKSVVEKSNSLSYEIIVVDNNSHDDSEYVIKSMGYSNIVYLKLSKNIGFGRANHEGIKVAKGEYIFLLNPDTLLINNAIKYLMDFLSQHKDVGVVGGNLYDINLKPTYSYHRYIPSIWTEEVNYLLLGIIWKLTKDFYYNHSNIPLSVGNVSGANMMFRRKDYFEVGGFDPDFFMYSEETELTVRFCKAGFKVFNVPNAKIIHLEGKSHVFKEQHELLKFQGRSLYYTKTYGKRYRQIADVVLIIALIFRVFVTVVIFNRTQIRLNCLRLKLILNYLIRNKRR